MTKTELKEAREEYFQRSKLLRESSLDEVMVKKETSEEQENRIVKLLKPRNYNAMSQHWFPELCPGDCAPFHVTAYNELVDNNIINQFLHGFRGSAKSTHATVINPFGLKQLGLMKFFLVVGINQDAAILLLSELQMQLESNERINHDFGNQKVYGDWAEGAFQTVDGCFFKALGLEKGKFRGLKKMANRIDHAVIDDCEDFQIAENPRLVANRVKKITGDLGNAFRKGRRRLVIANNYFVQGGLMDGLHEKLDGNFTKTHIINLSTGTADTPGDPTWPGYFTPEDVRLIHEMNDINTLKREHYNTAVSEGKVIKEEWLRYERLPANYKPEFSVGFWDLSYTKDGDYKARPVIHVWRNKMYLTEAFCRKCEVTEAVSHHYDTVESYKKRKLHTMWYFDATVAQEAVFLPLFQQEMIRRKLFDLPIPDHTSSVDKFLRMEATLVNVFFHGLLVIDERLKDSPDWKIAKAQILSLEKGMKGHDDFPDALENCVRKAQVHCVDRSGYAADEPVFLDREISGF